MKSTRELAGASLRSDRYSAFSLMEPLEQRQLFSTDITITTGTRFQTIDGFGTSLGGYTPDTLTKSAKFQKMYYQDLGSSMLRVALSFTTLKAADGNLATPVYLGPDLQKNIRLFNFKETHILQAGAFARASAKRGLGDVKIIASIWSPPHWMKGPEVNPYSGKPTGVMPKLDYTTYASVNASGGSLVDTDANLTQFGRYVAAYVKGFEQAYGVPLYAISIQNELAFHEPYHSAVYSPALYVDAVKAVSRWFRKYGIKTKLIGPEDVGVGSTSDPYVLSRQMSYIKALRGDPEASAAIWGYAIHGYAKNGVSENRSPQMWDQYWSGRDPRPSWTGIAGDDKPSWMTEISGGSNTWKGALRMAQNIQDSLVLGNASAWVYWGIAGSSSTYRTDSLTAGLDSSAVKYTAAKHFFHFVRPGARRVATSNNDPDGVYSSAFVDDKNNTLTTVIINATAKSQKINLSVPGVDIASFGTGYLSQEGALWKKLKSIPMRRGGIALSLPAMSIITLQASTAAPLKPGSLSGTYFNDHDADGHHDPADEGLGGDKVFLDLNRNGARDAREPFVVTKADGSFKFPAVAPGTYQVRRELPDGWKLTTAPLNVTVGEGKSVSALLIGVHKPGSTGGGPKLGSLSGRLFNDTNGNGQIDADDSGSAAKLVFLDADNDGVLDAGEKKTTSDADGNFSFTGLAAGTYHVRRVLPRGFTYSTTPINQTLTAGQTKTGLLIGSKAKAG